MTRLDVFPVALIEDRYTGVYSGGKWLAVANADQFEGGLHCAAYCLEHGPHAEDVLACEFWSNPPTWIASGDTPDNALANLLLASGIQSSE